MTFDNTKRQDFVHFEMIAKSIEDALDFKAEHEALAPNLYVADVQELIASARTLLNSQEATLQEYRRRVELMNDIVIRLDAENALLAREEVAKNIEETTNLLEGETT